jgi:hypothetical protein
MRNFFRSSERETLGLIFLFSGLVLVFYDISFKITGSFFGSGVSSSENYLSLFGVMLMVISFSLLYERRKCSRALLLPMSSSREVDDQRVRAAVEYYHNNPFTKVVITGNINDLGEAKDFSGKSALMYRALRRGGVGRAHIVIVGGASDPLRNVALSVREFSKGDVNHVIIVSDEVGVREVSSLFEVVKQKGSLGDGVVISGYSVGISKAPEYHKSRNAHMSELLRRVNSEVV